MKSILDPTFHYVNSYSTDVKKTFARARRKMNEETAPRQAALGGTVHVIQHKRRTSA